MLYLSSSVRKKKIIVRILPYIKHTQMLLFFFSSVKQVYEVEQYVFQRRYMNGQQDHEKMFNGTKHQNNAT